MPSKHNHPWQVSTTEETDSMGQRRVHVLDRDGSFVCSAGSSSNPENMERADFISGAPDRDSKLRNIYDLCDAHVEDSKNTAALLRCIKAVMIESKPMKEGQA